MQELRQDINLKLNPQKTPHSSPVRVSYGVSFVNIFKKIDHNIIALHSTTVHSCAFNSCLTVQSPVVPCSRDSLGANQPSGSRAEHCDSENPFLATGYQNDLSPGEGRCVHWAVPETVSETWDRVIYVQERDGQVTYDQEIYDLVIYDQEIYVPENDGQQITSVEYFVPGKSCHITVHMIDPSQGSVLAGD